MYIYLVDIYGLCFFLCCASEPYKMNEYLLFVLILGNKVEGDGVQRAGHDSKHTAEDQRGHDVGEEAN